MFYMALALVPLCAAFLLRGFAAMHVSTVVAGKIEAQLELCPHADYRRISMHQPQATLLAPRQHRRRRGKNNGGHEPTALIPSRRGRPAIEAQILGSLGHGSNATSILPNPFNLAPRCHRNSLPFGPYDRAWRFAFHESFSGSPLCRSLLTRPGCRRRAPPSAAATLARRSVRRALSQFPKCQITALKATSSAGHEGCSQLPSDVHTLDTHPAHSESNSVPGGSDQVSSTTVDARVSQQWQRWIWILRHQFHSCSAIVAPSASNLGDFQTYCELRERFRTTVDCMYVCVSVWSGVVTRAAAAATPRFAVP
eukprot:GHVT01080279.1.p1 GENE.GHVT01080279.1~~GHVT01080279.1.p1  ORF type:complete len:310 (+),score=31.55 GHVT01080279.1:380-1309(+)